MTSCEENGHAPGKTRKESNNVAEAHADVVKSLTKQIDAWADSLDIALTHQPAPARYHAPAAPEGEVLAVTVTVTDKAKPSDRLAISVANWSGSQYATDGIEYDIAFSPGTPARTRGSRRSKATIRNPSARSSSVATAWTSSDATRPPAPASPTARACGNTASSA